MCSALCSVHAARETFEEWFVIFIQLPSKWLFAKSKRNTLYNEMLYFNCLQKMGKKNNWNEPFDHGVYFIHIVACIRCIHTWHSSSYNIGNGRMHKNWSTWKLFNAQIYAFNWKRSPDLPQKQSQFFHQNNCGRYSYCTALEIHMKQLFDVRHKYCPQIGEDDFIRLWSLPFYVAKEVGIFTWEEKYFFMKYC